MTTKLAPRRFLPAVPLALLLLTAVFTPAAGQGYSDFRPVPRGRAIAGEAGGATVVGYGLGLAALLGTYRLLAAHPEDDFWDESNYGARLAAFGATILVTPPAFALGTWGTGSLMHQGGRYGPALLGACGGLFVAAALQLIPAFTYHQVYVVWALGAVLPPAGAVIGYNLGRPADASYGSIERRLEMPRMGLTMMRDEQNHPVTGFRCDLVSLRF
jgi:hypothetical protein